VNRLVRDNNSFCLEKVSENEFCKVVGTMHTGLCQIASHPQISCYPQRERDM